MAKKYMEYYTEIMDNVIKANKAHYQEHGIYALCPKDLAYINQGLALLASAHQIEFEADSGYLESNEFDLIMRRKRQYGIYLDVREKEEDQ